MEPPHQQPTSPQQAYYLPAGMAAVPPAAAPVYAAPPLQQAAPPMGAMPAPAALGGGGMQQQLLPQQQQLMGQPAAAVGAKRPLDDASAASPRGAADAKRLHVEGQGGGAAATPRETVYRLVLDVADTALIIGRGGNTVRAIEQATGEREWGQRTRLQRLQGSLRRSSFATLPLPPTLPLLAPCRRAHQAAAGAAGVPRADGGHLEPHARDALAGARQPEHGAGAAAQAGWAAGPRLQLHKSDMP